MVTTAGGFQSQSATAAAARTRSPSVGITKLGTPGWLIACCARWPVTAHGWNPPLKKRFSTWYQNVRSPVLRHRYAWYTSQPIGARRGARRGEVVVDHRRHGDAGIVEVVPSPETARCLPTASAGSAGLARMAAPAAHAQQAKRARPSGAVALAPAAAMPASSHRPRMRAKRQTTAKTTSNPSV